MNTPSLRSLLSEARRYAASNPDEARAIASDAAEEIFAAAVKDLPRRVRLERSATNLVSACKFLRHDPEAFRGYCYAVSAELAWLFPDKEPDGG